MLLSCPRYLTLFCCLYLTFADDARPYHNSLFYDAGFWGAYPHRTLSSSALVEPTWNVITWSEECDDGYILLTPRGGSVPDPGPMIVDARGNLVWAGADGQYGDTENLRLQTFNGSNYLTFWAGTDDGTHGRGSYYMIDEHYDVKYVVSPVGDLDGDLHEFKITSNNTALMTIYNNIPYDLSSLSGPTNGWLIESVFQEVDLITGELIFEWRSSEHCPITDTVASIEGFGRKESDGFDYFHINSVDKDEFGNYYISSRYLCAVLCISGVDGSILWRLGGRDSSFEDLSSGAASNFTWNHHFTYLDTAQVSSVDSRVQTFSLFDNAAYNWHYTPAKESRALLLQLDVTSMTATLLNAYSNPMTLLSHSQGSVQVLPLSGLSGAETGAEANPESDLSTSSAVPWHQRLGNIFVGFGHSAAFTEFRPDGTVLCDVHFGSYAFWSFGWAKSYRAFKVPDTTQWVGRPKTRPSIAMAHGKARRGHGMSNHVFASWNGDTVVRTWRLQGAERYVQSSSSDGNWITLMEQPKRGFEADFDLADVTKEHSDDSMPLHSWKLFRVQALDESGEVIGTTHVVDRHSRQVLDGSGTMKMSKTDAASGLTMLTITGCMLFSLVVITAAKRSWNRMSRRGGLLAL